MAKPKQKKKMGRPRKEVDFDKIDKLCQFHCTAQEIVDHLNIFDADVSYDTVERRIKERFGIAFKEYIKKRCFGLAKPRLRALQFKAAEAGNVTMLIWLGKQYLGQKEPLHTEKIQENVTMNIDFGGKKEDEKKKIGD